MVLLGLFAVLLGLFAALLGLFAVLLGLFAVFDQILSYNLHLPEEQS